MAHFRLLNDVECNKYNGIRPLGWIWYRLYIPIAITLCLTVMCYAFTLNYKLVFVGSSDRCIPGWVFVVDMGELPKSGDLAMVLSHQTDILPAGVKIIKLVAGVAGDTMTVDKYKVMNDSITYYAPVSEAALFLDRNIEDLTGRFVVPSDSYFMIGTFPGSYDSRFFGPVKGEQVVGRAYLII